MFSWGEECRRGFRLKDGTYEAKENENEVCYLDLGYHITHLSEGLHVLAFVKTNGNAFIIRTNDDRNGTRTRGKQKCVECKEKITAACCTDDVVTLLTKKGQLFCVTKANPKPQKCLSSVQVSQVSCGSQHSLALTKDGQVFTWGLNSRGQLGLGPDVSSVASPERVHSLSDLPLVQVASGGEHSFSLSLSGAVFGWGNNFCGQLGLGDTTDRHHPTVVHYLNTKKVSSISCGFSHTAVLTKDGAVFTFGSGEHGQLGHNSFRDELRPRFITELFGSKVMQVACGRQHTLVMTESQRLFSFGFGDQGQLGHRGESHPAVPLPVHLPPEHSDGAKIGTIFAGAYCSFATCFSENNDDMHTVSNIATWERQPSLGNLILKWISGSESMKQTKIEILRTFSSLSRLNRNFLELRKDKHFQTSPNYCGLDLKAAKRSFASLLNKSNVLEQVEAAVLDSLCLNVAPVGVEALRVYLLLTELLVVVLKHNKHSMLAEKLAAAIHNLPPESRKVLRDWHASLSLGTRKRHVEVWRKALSQKLLSNSHAKDFKNLALILEDMHKINALKTGDEKIPEATFSFGLSENLLQNDVRLWRSTKARQQFYIEPFVFCNYKFLMDLQSKKKAFDLDCYHTQREHQEPQQMFFDWVLGWQSQPDFLHLELTRTSLVEDTFQQLAACSDKALRKPLIVHFDGDSKITDVYKRDLFHHLFLEIVSADSKMLVFNESRTLAWFPSKISKEKKQRFFLFGKLCGPTLGQSLQYLLNYEDDVEDLDMYFTIDWDETEVELDPSNPGKPVTNDNRQEFVDAYVCELSTVQLFRPEELRGVMVGTENYDWAAFKENTVYDFGYHKRHPTIQMFWEVFEELNEEQKKDFLWFVTGYRRAPIFGLGHIRMQVRVKSLLHNRTDEHFPESLTCHSILDLPLYSTKDVMRKE
ncbi:hypothetical protein WMY93_023941 [Mugilogobius chulae]|uniref:HECT domain-containing protein n=1 Tax=Mugilogobius chulae TaxID=88201 RepID=A0AAW0NAL8_9GOBI